MFPFLHDFSAFFSFLMTVIVLIVRSWSRVSTQLVRSQTVKYWPWIWLALALWAVLFWVHCVSGPSRETAVSDGFFRWQWDIPHPDPSARGSFDPHPSIPMPPLFLSIIFHPLIPDIQYFHLACCERLWKYFLTSKQTPKNCLVGKKPRKVIEVSYCNIYEIAVFIFCCNLFIYCRMSLYYCPALYIKLEIHYK